MTTLNVQAHFTDLKAQMDALRNLASPSSEACAVEDHEASTIEERVRSSLKSTGIKCLVAVQETSKAVKELQGEEGLSVMDNLNRVEKALKDLDSEALARQVRNPSVFYASAVDAPNSGKIERQNFYRQLQLDAPSVVESKVLWSDLRY